MIAMTPNIARRRALRFWEGWARMLAGTLPLWIVPLLIAMAFPVMKPGSKILFKNGLPVFGACSCCNGGTSDVPCSFCASTPLTLTISFTGVLNACGCEHRSGGGYSFAGSPGDTLGTFTLTQAAACGWAYDGTGFISYAGDTCGSLISYDRIIINADVLSGVTVQVRADTFTRDTFSVFFGAATLGSSPANCCAEMTMSNSYTTCTSNVNNRLGYQGTAVVTTSCA